jgi:hypothetical protein
MPGGKRLLSGALAAMARSGYIVRVRSTQGACHGEGSKTIQSRGQKAEANKSQKKGAASAAAKSPKR